MTKKDIEKWGKELKPEEFAGALAFLLHKLFEEAPAGIPAEYFGLKNPKSFFLKLRPMTR